MALLTVLLLVAVMAAIAALVLDDVRFSVRRATNAEGGAQAQWYGLGAEALARRSVARLNAADPARTRILPAWNGRVVAFPIEGGGIQTVLTDGQACFNLNSVVEGAGEFLVRRPAGVEQFIVLGLAVGLAEAKAHQIADGLTDWMDADTAARPQGAEDAAYVAAGPGYRTSGQLLSEVSELRAIRGVDADSYARLRPFVCALPTSAPSAINVNTLTSDQSLLLLVLTNGKLSRAAARILIADRPAEGWATADAFWSQPQLTRLSLVDRATSQAEVRTRYFNLRADIDYGGARMVRSALLEVLPDGRVRTVARRWGPEE